MLITHRAPNVDAIATAAVHLADLGRITGTVDWMCSCWQGVQKGWCWGQVGASTTDRCHPRCTLRAGMHALHCARLSTVHMHVDHLVALLHDCLLLCAEGCVVNSPDEVSCGCMC